MQTHIHSLRTGDTTARGFSTSRTGAPSRLFFTRRRIIFPPTHTPYTLLCPSHDFPVVCFVDLNAIMMKKCEYFVWFGAWYLLFRMCVIIYCDLLNFSNFLYFFAIIFCDYILYPIHINEKLPHWKNFWNCDPKSIKTRGATHSKTNQHRFIYAQTHLRPYLPFLVFLNTLTYIEYRKYQWRSYAHQG